MRLSLGSVPKLDPLEVCLMDCSMVSSSVFNSGVTLGFPYANDSGGQRLPILQAGAPQSGKGGAPGTSTFPLLLAMSKQLG